MNTELVPPAGAADNGRGAGAKARDLAVALFFALLSLILSRAALFSGGARVSGIGKVDTWIHLWAFRRAFEALAGRDAGYFSSHFVTYPAVIREPIAAFDPLLSILSAPLQLAWSVPTVFNLLVWAGLLFTSLVGYEFLRHLTGSRPAALVGGIVLGCNPFLLRQIEYGYSEYAWWGVFPLAVCAYLRAIDLGGNLRTAAYVAAFLLMVLFSIYCTALFCLFAACHLAVEALRALLWPGSRFREIVRLQAVLAVCLLPLVAFWWSELGKSGFKGLQPDKRLSLERLLPPLADGGVRASAGESAPEIDLGALFPHWRPITGSFDLKELFSVGAPNTEAELSVRREGVLQRLRIPTDTAERTSLRELLFPLGLALLGVLLPATRRRCLPWIALGAVYLVVAAGPFPVWDGVVRDAVRLPYAWLYDHVPGFARLVIPGRAFWGVLLCLAVPAAHALAEITGRARERFATRPFAVPLALAAAVLLAVLAGTGGRAISTMPAAVPALYDPLTRDPVVGAVLELPISRGDIARRMFAQTAHGRPIFRGMSAVQWLTSPDTRGVEEHPLVRLLEAPVPGLEAAVIPAGAGTALAGMGFRYLVLHRDGYSPQAYPGARARAAAVLGAPDIEDREGAAWQLGEPRPARRGVAE